MTFVAVERLSVRSRFGTILHPLDFVLGSGETLVVIGESGAGKSLLAEAILGSLPSELVATGTVRLGQEVFDAADRTGRRKLWGRTIAMLPQECWTSLDPIMRARHHVSDVYRFLHRRTRHDAARAATEELRLLSLAEHAGSYPWQLSGGMAQRLALAAVRATRAGILIADEPTKGLDDFLCDTVAAHLRAEAASGKAVLVVTHDLGLARALGGRLMVLRDGRLVEEGETGVVLTRPRSAYTRALIAADPATWPKAKAFSGNGRVISARGVSCQRGGRRLFDNLDLAIDDGETVAVCGPSGCGKTTLGDILVGLLRPDRGIVERATGVRSVRFQKLWQDPPAAFAPRRSLRRALEDVCRRHGVTWNRVEALMARLSLAEALLDRLPRQVSGGELQRLALLRALLVEPVFLFADEATSRLDPLTQAQTIRLLLEVQTEQRMALLLATHHRALAEAVAHKIVRLA